MGVDVPYVDCLYSTVGPYETVVAWVATRNLRFVGIGEDFWLTLFFRFVQEGLYTTN